jgi:hypothetical protein
MSRLLSLGLLLASWLVLMSCSGTSSPASDDSTCSLEVVNPTCGNGTQLPTDQTLPCYPLSPCANSTGVVDCQNWICSLRLNCGCFAGQVTSCRTNSSSCNKDGCSMMVSMFQESSCKFEDFFGPRKDPNAYNTYLNQCLDGCGSSARVIGWSALCLASLVASTMLLLT